MVQSADQKYVADVFYRTPDDPEANANAKLIAAAPELLEACKSLIATCNGLVDQQAMPDDWWECHVKSARAAIAKATL
jgi:predicted alpha-1,6-mannanase (GH76 family)